MKSFSINLPRRSLNQLLEYAKVSNYIRNSKSWQHYLKKKYFKFSLFILCFHKESMFVVCMFIKRNAWLFLNVNCFVISNSLLLTSAILFPTRDAVYEIFSHSVSLVVSTVQRFIIADPICVLLRHWSLSPNITFSDKCRFQYTKSCTSFFFKYM